MLRGARSLAQGLMRFRGHLPASWVCAGSIGIMPGMSDLTPPAPMLESAAGWLVYVIEAGDGSLYTGITTDIERRWQQHVDGRGARYLRGREPRAVVYVESGHDRSSAARREAAIKKLSRMQKLALIAETKNKPPATSEEEPAAKGRDLY